MSRQVGSSSLFILPTAVKMLVGTRLAEDTGDDLPCREHRALMLGLAKHFLVSEVLPTMAYKLSPYKSEKDDQLEELRIQ